MKNQNQQMYNRNQLKQHPNQSMFHKTNLNRKYLVKVQYHHFLKNHNKKHLEKLQFKYNHLPHKNRRKKFNYKHKHQLLLNHHYFSVDLLNKKIMINHNKELKVHHYLEIYYKKLNWKHQKIKKVNNLMKNKKMIYKLQLQVKLV